MSGGAVWTASSVSHLRSVIADAARSRSRLHTVILDPIDYVLDEPLPLGTPDRPDFWRFEGAGRGMTTLRGVGDGFDMLHVLGREVSLSDLTITSDDSRRAGTVGCGIRADNGATQTTQSRLLLDRVSVHYQPEHGLVAVDPELHGYTDVDFMRNGGDGYRFEAGHSLPWNNTLTRVRSTHNTGLGFYAASDHYTTFLGCQFYSNQGGAQARINGGRGSTFINGDFENIGATEATAGDGLVLAGSGHRVIGGHFSTFSRGVVFDYASWCRVEQPYFTNESAPFSMTGLTVTAKSSDNRHDLRTAYPNVTPLADAGTRTTTL